MSITVHEALQLENFKNFKVIAGKSGFKNKIKKIGILDYETEDLIEENFAKDEFVISTLLVIKDRMEELYKIVERLILIGVSGLAIKTVYINTLPNEVIELADNKSFPIMTFNNAYFEDVITGIRDALKEKEEEQALALKIDDILYGDLNKVNIKKISFEINREFKEKNVVIFFKETEGIKENYSDNRLKKITHENYYNFSKVIAYKDGHIIVFTFDKIQESNVKDIILRRLELLDINSQKYSIGIGELHEKLEELNYSIKESIYAFKYAKAYKKGISFFGDIGINKILLPLMDNIWIHKYYEKLIIPILLYDSKNNTELLKTAVAYVENNGNIKAVAEEMNQHNNTIRYRIDKIYNIIGKEFKNEQCYEELAVAIKIHKLLELSL